MQHKFILFSFEGQKADTCPIRLKPGVGRPVFLSLGSKGKSIYLTHLDLAQLSSLRFRIKVRVSLLVVG